MRVAMVSSLCSFKGLSSSIFLFMLLFLATRIEVDAVPLDPLYILNASLSLVLAGILISTFAWRLFTLVMGAITFYDILSVVAVDHLTANATGTTAKIDSLLKKEGRGAPMRWCLQSCQALYGSILQMQPRCLDLVKVSRYNEAKSCLDQAARATELCEAEFVRSHIVSPLKAENDCAFKLARLAYALIEHVND